VGRKKERGTASLNAFDRFSVEGERKRGSHHNTEGGGEKGKKKGKKEKGRGP